MAILNRMVKDGNNVGKPYVEDRVHFLAGLTPEEILEMGYACYQTSYRNKFYPEMKQLIANLKEYGFEVWILTLLRNFYIRNSWPRTRYPGGKYPGGKIGGCRR